MTDSEPPHANQTRKPPTEESFTKAASDMMKVAKYWGWSYLYVVPGSGGSRDVLWVEDVDNQIGSGCPVPGHTEPPEGSILLTKLHAVGPGKELPCVRDVEEQVFLAYGAFWKTVESTLDGSMPPTPDMRSARYRKQPTSGSLAKAAADMRNVAKGNRIVKRWRGGRC